MNTLTILFVLPLLIIFSYIFDSIAKKTKFPSVILLMFTGMILRFGVDLYGAVNLGFLDQLIPVLGTLGLILIVLEGALELDINRQKIPLILKGFFAAFIILLANIIGLSFIFETVLLLERTTAVVYAIPLSIISSAVAIPSASGLLSKDKEFVVYESTFSDILGIIAFNYALTQYQNEAPLIGFEPLFALGIKILGVIAISMAITYCLFQLLQQIEQHIKFFLILALLVLVYAFGKYFHLPALVTIFIFGLFLKNVASLLPQFLQKHLVIEKTHQGFHEFHILTAESTFLVKTFFFLFFGFSVSFGEFDSAMPLFYGLLILGTMVGLRYLYFLITQFKIKPSPLLYMSPRGLISILLFLQIKDLDFIPKTLLIDERVLLVVILLSMLVMTFGNLKHKKAEDNEGEIEEAAEDEMPIIKDLNTPENLLDLPNTNETQE